MRLRLPLLIRIHGSPSLHGTRRQQLRRPRAARTLDALGEALNEHLSEPLSQTPAAAHQRALADRRSSLLFPPRRRAAYQREMKRGSEEKGTEQDAKKPKERAAPSAGAEEGRAPICNVGNLLEICDQDVDFAVELVGEGGQEMTGHAAKAVSRRRPWTTLG